MSNLLMVQEFWISACSSPSEILGWFLILYLIMPAEGHIRKNQKEGGHHRDTEANETDASVPWLW